MHPACPDLRCISPFDKRRGSGFSPDLMQMERVISIKFLTLGLGRRKSVEVPIDVHVLVQDAHHVHQICAGDKSVIECM